MLKLAVLHHQDHPNFGLLKEGVAIYLRRKNITSIVKNNFNKVFVQVKSNCSQIRQLDH